LHAAKAPVRAPPGLGTRVSDVVAGKVDVRDGMVEFQRIPECLSGEQRGREQSYRIAVTGKVRAFHRAEHKKWWDLATWISSSVIVSFSPRACKQLFLRQATLAARRQDARPRLAELPGLFVTHLNVEEA